MVAGGVIPSTHIRLESPFNWLSAEGLVHVGFVLEHEVRPEMADWADILIIQRCTSELSLRLLRHVKAIGKPVIYECDDNFLAITRSTPAVGEYYSRPDVRATFIAMLSESDVVTLSTEPLAEEFAKFTDSAVLLPNCVDYAHISPGPRLERSDRVVLGYAGTVTHGPDFDVVEPVLRRLLKEYEGHLAMQFFGFVPPVFAEHAAVSFVPYSNDYPGFLRTLSEVDWSFGIAPLADRRVNHYKTDNKYREYGACGIPGVYSDLSVYSGCVRHEVNGLLTPHTQQSWYRALKRLIVDPKLRRSIAAAARDDVSQRYSVESAARAWYDVLGLALGGAVRT